MRRFLPLLALVVISACAPQTIKLIPASAFESEIEGKPVSLYTISGGGLTAQVTNYGARVVSLWVPDLKGRMADVVIGYGTLDDYVNNPGERFLGSSPGPVANRIGGASFELDGAVYNLDKNDGNNTLHGGFKGIDHLVWEVSECNDSSIMMQVLHPDGLGGFPGNKTISVRYTLTSDSALKVEFGAETDAPTLINLAHHPFFNLKGSGQGDILDHVLVINASRTTPVDAELIPTGEIVQLDGSPLDFREPHTIGERIGADDEQLQFGHGYDHNWVIDRADGEEITLDATVYEPQSGRFLEVLSDQPGLQFYSGNFFGDGKTVDKFGNAIAYRGALALETQKYPDSIHYPGFTDTVLRPGETYTHTCFYRFSCR
ncbi:MAG: galactose mutarotase [Bacteroidales bacterium]|nr:galactose mutarotase [Bacteroidales bacterium]